MVLNQDFCNFYSTPEKIIQALRIVLCNSIFKYILSIWTILLELFYSCLKGLIWKKIQAEVPTFLQYKDHMYKKNRVYKEKINLYFIIRWSILETTRFNYVFSHLLITASQFSECTQQPLKRFIL